VEEACGLAMVGRTNRALDLSRKATAQLKANEGEKAFSTAQEALDLCHETNGVGKTSAEAVYEALHVIVKVCAERTSPREALRIVNLEVARFKKCGDAIGEAAALPLLVQAQLAYGDDLEAISTGGKALSRLIILDHPEMEARVALTLCKPYMAVENFHMAKASAIRAKEVFVQLGDRKWVAEANQAHIVACEASGDDVPPSDHRSEARLVLQDVAKAIRARDSVAYADAMEVLGLTGGVVQRDVTEVIAPLYKEDHKDIAEFVKGLTPPDTTSSIVQSSVRGKNGIKAESVNETDFYLPIRVGGLFYGPRYRQCRGYRLMDVPPDEWEIFGANRHSSQASEWEKEGFDPAVLDAYSHMGFMLGLPPLREREELSKNPPKEEDMLQESDGPREGPRIPFFMDQGTLCPSTRRLGDSTTTYSVIAGTESMCFATR